MQKVFEISTKGQHNTISCLCFLYSVLQNRSIHKSRDGVVLFCQPNIHNCCEVIVLLLRNIFKYLGHTQFLEICATSKEVVLFHDNDFVLLRFACGFNYSSINRSCCNVMVD